MQRCPSELRSYILALACVDDGRTYRSLSSVSRHYRSLALPYRFQSLSLTSQCQIQRVSEQLSSIPAHLRRIKHVFVSDTPITFDDEKTSSFDLADTDILFILQLAAPTLESLVFNGSSSPLSSTSLIANIFSTPMHHLLHLSVVGYYPYPHGDYTGTSTMPRLESLHLAGNRNPLGLLQAGNLDRACPALKELRISGLSQAVSFSIELEAAITSSAESPISGFRIEAPLSSATLPPHLTEMALHLSPTLPQVANILRSPAALKDKEMRRICHKLESLGVNGRKDSIRVTNSTGVETSGEMRRSWIEKLGMYL